MLYDEHADACLIGETVQASDRCIIPLILAVLASGSWPDRGERIDDQEPRIRCLLDPALELHKFAGIKTWPVCREQEPIRPVFTARRNPRQTLLEPPWI